jgi:hypothetical protein
MGGQCFEVVHIFLGLLLSLVLCENKKPNINAPSDFQLLDRSLRSMLFMMNVTQYKTLPLILASSGLASG